MPSPEFQVAFGVKGEDVISSLKDAGIVIGIGWEEGEYNLVDEGVFQGMYNGNGDCAEWLGLELFYLDNSDPFINMTDISYQDNEFKRIEHYIAYQAKVTNLKTWLSLNGCNLEGELKLPEPSYFIACGTY